MVKTDHSKKCLLLAACFLVMTAPGCDQITSIKEYFNKPDKPAPSQSTPAPATSATSKKAEMTADTLARVGNWTITQAEFNERLQALGEVVPDFNIEDPEAKSLVLEELVRQQLLVQDAEQRGVANDPEIMEAVDEFRKTLIVRQVANQLTQNIQVTEDEARAFYEENKEALVNPEEWRIREIVVDSQIKANEVLLEVLKGVSFAEMAKQNSISKTASLGGNLGFIDRVPFPEMGAALSSLDVGDVSSVFKGPEGYYIVKVEEKRGGEPLAFDEIKDEIIQNQTLQKQQQAILDHIEKLEAKTQVDIREELLQ